MTDNGIIVTGVDKSDPAYSDGFWAFMHGSGFDLDRNHDGQYVFGWQAAERVGVLMTKHGFDRDGDSFTKTVELPPPPASTRGDQK